MSSFQFPANPADGDIVVRGDLQAFYNAATNTWRVSQLPDAPGIPGPPGPPGPEGPPGQGVSISGSVATYADLPAPNTAQFNFWITDDTNTLWYSDGIQWIDFGSPIQGPPGDPGDPGRDGTNGQNGRGWYDTQITDDANGYRIQFLSNDGLGFFTGDLRGPAGNLEVASETNLGGIKIGKGLSIEPDGTANAAQAYVNIDGVELPDNYILNLTPVYTDFNGQTYTSNEAYNSRQDELIVYQDEVTVPIPAAANGALITWFQNTNMGNNPNKPLPASQVHTFMGLYQVSLEVEGASYTTSNMAVNHFHNTAANAGVESITQRASAVLTTKTNELRFNPGTTSLKFKRTFRLIRAAYVSTTLGLGRLQITPFKTDSAAPFTPFDAFAQPGDPEYVPPSTPDEILKEQADQLKFKVRQAILQGQTMLTLHPTYINDTEKAVIEQTVADLISTRTLPATPDELEAYVDPLIEQLNAIIDFTYPFEP